MTRVTHVTRWNELVASYPMDLIEALEQESSIDINVLPWDYTRSSVLTFFAPLIFIGRLIDSLKDTDILHIQYVFGNYHLLFLPVVFFFARVYKFKVILTLHEHYEYTEIPNLLRKLANTHRRLIVPFADKIIIHSEVERERLPSTRLQRNSTVVPHGVRAGSASNYDRDNKIIFIPGRISSDKDHMTVIRAIGEVLEENPDVKFIIAGRPDNPTIVDNIRNRAEEMGVTQNLILNTNFIPSDEYERLFSSCTFAILPYPADASTSGILADTLQYHCPAIISSNPVFIEYTQNEALYFLPGSESQLANKINELLNSEDQRRKLIESFRKLKNKYLWSKVASHHTMIYKEVYDG